MNPTPTPTRRTDATVIGNSDPTQDEYEDLASFARQLERELTAARDLTEAHAKTQTELDKKQCYEKWYSELIEVIYGDIPEGVNELPDPRDVVKNLRAELDKLRAELAEVKEEKS